MPYRLILLAACAAVPATGYAQSSDPHWRVVVANSDADAVLPSLLPGAGNFDISRVVLSDGDGTLGFARQHSTEPHSLWVERNAALAPYATLLATGAAGPGRSGGEAGHVFRTLWYKTEGSVGAHRVFAARAGDPTQPADAATYGIWRWNGQRNTEIARLDTAGGLAPGFTPDIQFTSFGSTGNTNYPNSEALSDGRALIQATVTGGLKAVVLHTPGQGNQGCLLENSTDPAWSPDVDADAYFLDSGLATIQSAVPSADGAVYIAAAYRIGAGSSQRGIFRLCDGAPRSLARSGVTGAFGPGLADTTATFTEFDRVRPNDQGGLFFWARGTGAAGAFSGGFHHGYGLNRPLWLNGTDGSYGPGYTSYAFDQSGAPVLFAAGQYAVLHTTIRPAAGSTSIRGLWRLRPGQSPEPVAIVGDTGAYAPAAGRAWRSFALTTILDNGDILTVAEISNPTTTGVWRLRPGAAPERLLAVGDLVSTPTATGLVQREVTSISTSAFDDMSPRTDSWASRQGDVLVRANVQGIPSTAQVHVRGRGGRSDALFAHDFD